MFSSDPEVVSIVASIAPFAAVGELMDGFGASPGVLRGCGRPVAYTTLTVPTDRKVVIPGAG